MTEPAISGPYAAHPQIGELPVEVRKRIADALAAGKRIKAIQVLHKAAPSHGLATNRSIVESLPIIGPFEVAEMELYPVEHLRAEPAAKRRAQVDAIEYSAYVSAIQNSKYKAILNERTPPVSPPVELPKSYRFNLIPDDLDGWCFVEADRRTKSADHEPHRVPHFPTSAASTMKRETDSLGRKNL